MGVGSVTDVPGLYFLGLPWQHTRGSALLGFVRDDAAHQIGDLPGPHIQAGRQARRAAMEISAPSSG